MSIEKAGALISSDNHAQSKKAKQQGQAPSQGGMLSNIQKSAPLVSPRQQHFLKKNMNMAGQGASSSQRDADKETRCTNKHIAKQQQTKKRKDVKTAVEKIKDDGAGMSSAISNVRNSLVERTSANDGGSVVLQGVGSMATMPKPFSQRDNFDLGNSHEK